jgi:hypothetical protein
VGDKGDTDHPPIESGGARTSDNEVREKLRAAQNQKATPLPARVPFPRPAPFRSQPPSAAVEATAPPADRIFVTYDETTVPGTFHTAIHYQRVDASGKITTHQVVEAKPERGDLNLAMKVIGTIEGLGERTGPSVFKNIRGEIRDGESPDKKLPYQIIAEDNDLSRNWQKILNYVDEFNTKGYAYRGAHQNSNTFASAALRAGELPEATGIGTDPNDQPGNLWEYMPPGLNEELDPPVGISK